MDPRNSDAADASPAESDFSSCDGSDPDRYCSANSALGTASLCSSIGNSSELLDSLKNSSRWNGDLQNLSSIDDGGIGTPSSNQGARSFSRIRNRSKLFLQSVDKISKSVENSGEEFKLEYGSSSGYNLEGLSSCEHSEGEDSMIGYGSDDGGRVELHKGYGLQKNKEIVEGGNGNNPLFMSSSVAFGADDWDEFVQENGGNGLASLSMDLIGQKLDSLDARDVQFENPLKDFGVVLEDIGKGSCHGRVVSSVGNEKISAVPDADETSMKWVPGESRLSVSTLHESIAEQSYRKLNRVFHGKEMESQESYGPSSSVPVVEVGEDSTFESIIEGNSDSINVVGEDEGKKLETYDSYEDLVLEMEDILLDSGNSHIPRSQANQGFAGQHSRHIRDGSSTASTSGTEDTYPLAQHPTKIDSVEVVGAKQKTGDVSFGERLVGVKEYTMYTIRVWSGENQWEIERRYRDFFSLYCQLNTLFTNNGLSLPSPWSSVEQESRKIFGNASPSVVSERSTLIQNCLRSILNSEYPFGTPSSLICFLSPGKAMPSTSLLKSFVPQSLQKLGQELNSNFSKGVESGSLDASTLGKTISLVVEMKPHKSMSQMLEAQHYTCAGCHRHLDAGKTLLRELVQTFGWNKPRFCEYTGQLFCSSCHSNDSAVLPAKVLHHWDFSLYPVSQLAKAYLESIYDQPMLCVSAVNPFLFSKVPALLHVMGVRKKIGAMLPHVRCPFRRSVQRSLGIRKYLLGSNDFFALRDLVDLSKGAFAALPVMAETVSSKILEHVTEQCLVCYDSGVPCAARQACDDPSSLIFPFHEAEAEKCGSCGSIFHKPCFVKLMGCCPCGKLPADGRKATGSTDFNGVSDRSLQPSNSSLSSGFFSEILSKARPDKIWRPKNHNPVILMGSLPSTAL